MTDDGVKSCCYDRTHSDRLGPDRNYLENVKKFVKKELLRRLGGEDKDKDAAQTANAEAPVVNNEEEWLAKHNYHLSWAVFKNMPSEYLESIRLP